MKKKNYKYNFFKWVARILSFISIAILSLFVLGNGFNPFAMKIYDILLFIFFPTCIVLGMIVAWFDELEGSLFSILSLIIFYVLFYICKGYFPQGMWFLIFTSPAFIFLFFSLLNIKTYIKLKRKC